MLGLRRINGISLDLFQGDAEDFISDLLLSFGTHKDKGSMWTLVAVKDGTRSTYFEETFRLAVNHCEREQLRHIALKLPPSDCEDTFEIAQDLFFAIKAVASRPYQSFGRFTFLLPSLAAYDHYQNLLFELVGES